MLDFEDLRNGDYTRERHDLSNPGRKRPHSLGGRDRRKSEVFQKVTAGPTHETVRNEAAPPKVIFIPEIGLSVNLETADRRLILIHTENTGGSGIVASMQTDGNIIAQENAVIGSLPSRFEGGTEGLFE